LAVIQAVQKLASSALYSGRVCHCDFRYNMPSAGNEDYNSRVFQMYYDGLSSDINDFYPEQIVVPDTAVEDKKTILSVFGYAIFTCTEKKMLQPQNSYSHFKKLLCYKIELGNS